ncbi:major facilitator superfamily domain-containing protein [Neohortaea acidophila]|uniref:Cercosporin MFS transporter CTB4 n=1 Tax=Neohortaea acidophila TaxID=245834 RepID=A0A6A6PPY1_9PEZI|nr:major facilitator superfamily domain-containing protein [Neohortaea acidophila]KAF2482158.1 major facilitator superfamily domain-containing protein [Neohortaea acidophila]
MANTPRSTIGTVKSWNTGHSGWTDTDSYSLSNRPIEEVEEARLRSGGSTVNASTDEFPWISHDHIEPIRHQHTSLHPPQWFREGQATNNTFNNNNSAIRRGNSVRSTKSLPRESIVDLHLIVSDLDYYAGAVHDFQAEEEEDEEWEWDDEEQQGEWPLPQQSDGATFGQIQIIRGGTVKRGASTRSKKGEKDINLVTWDGPGDPDNPKNWPRRKKWLATITVSLFTFISPVSSSMIAPALGHIRDEFHTSMSTTNLALSAFILGFAVGPLFLGPLSEIFGRRIILQLSNLFYFVFNLACGFSQNIGQIVAFRFLSGLGGSAPLGIGGGVLGDIWLPQERGKAMALYSLMPLLGPAIGPIAGGFIAQNTTWRWVFYSTSIAAMLVQGLGLFFLQETYAAALLTSKKKELIKITGNRELHTEFDTPNRKFRTHIGIALQRPFRLLATQPIVQILALYIGFVYGVLYLVLATFPVLWTSPRYYNESIEIGGLNYISLGLGFFVGTQIAARTADRIYKHLKARNGDVGRSEFRVPLMFPGAIMVPIGLALYGWTAEYRVFWLVPNIGTAIFAAGNQLVFQNCQTYIVDAYTRYAASAIAATTLFRSLGGFAFPLFANAMYDALGWGWGNTVLACAAVAIGLPAPFILWWYGESLRKRSQYAAG